MHICIYTRTFSCLAPVSMAPCMTKQNKTSQCICWFLDFLVFQGPGRENPKNKEPKNKLHISLQKKHRFTSHLFWGVLGFFLVFLGIAVELQMPKPCSLEPTNTYSSMCKDESMITSVLCKVASCNRRGTSTARPPALFHQEQATPHAVPEGQK